eukprot:m51a1_g11158 hypothetical protein (67) ;mRNA; f:283750-283950
MEQRTLVLCVALVFATGAVVCVIQRSSCSSPPQVAAPAVVLDRAELGRLELPDPREEKYPTNRNPE